MHGGKEPVNVDIDVSVNTHTHTCYNKQVVTLRYELARPVK